MSELPEPRLFSCADATGAVHDQGAHVTDWIPTGHAPVLWLSPSTALETGKPVRGGVPICFPWFADGAEGGREPKHGFARTLPWHVESRESSDHEAMIVYRLSDADVTDPAHREQFPYQFEAYCVVRFGTELSLELSVTNTGERPFDFEEALHAYLVVGDVRKIRVEGLDGASYRDKVLDREDCVQEGDLRFDGETDRVYRSTGDVAVVDLRRPADADARLAAAEVACGNGDPLWRADLLHLNDWPSGLASAYLAWRGQRIPTILTIHNLAYQGNFDRGRLSHLGIPDADVELVARAAVGDRVEAPDVRAPVGHAGERREQRRPGSRGQLPQTVRDHPAHGEGHQRAVEALKARTRLVRRGRPAVRRRSSRRTAPRSPPR